MSEFQVEVIELTHIEKHPQADLLSIAKVNGDYPVIFKTESFSQGDKVVYLPVDSLVPVSNPLFSFLDDGKGDERKRIKARRLRGIFSMGMLVPADPSWEVGQNVQKELNVEKYEPNVPGVNVNAHSEAVEGPSILPVYTDIEGLRRYPNVLQEGEEVVITEKCHGMNIRAIWVYDSLHVGSHRQFKKRDERNVWWKIASDYNLEEKLKTHPSIGIYGEAYGQVQDLKYGTKPGEVKLLVFDVYNSLDGTFFNYDDCVSFCKQLDLPMVPELYRGPWNNSLKELAEGSSTLASHVREGFVVKPVVERFDYKVRRVIFKMIGEGYLLRKK